jgi:protease I
MSATADSAARGAALARMQQFMTPSPVPSISTELLTTADGDLNRELHAFLFDPPINPTLLKGKTIAICCTNGVEEVEITGAMRWLTEHGATVHVVAPRIGEFHPTLGLRFPPLCATHVLAIRLMENAGWIKIDRYVDEVKVADYDAVLVPGGCWNPDFLRNDKHAQQFLRAMHAAGKPTCAILPAEIFAEFPHNSTIFAFGFDAPYTSARPGRIIFHDGNLLPFCLGLRKSCFAQAVVCGLKNGFALTKPFDGQFRINLASLGQSLLGFFRLALKRVSGRQIEIRVKGTVTAVDRLAARFDRGVQVSKAEFSVGEPIAPLAQRGIVRAKAHGCQNIGLRLLKLAQIRPDDAAQREEKSAIGVSRKPLIDDPARVPQTRTSIQISGLSQVCQDVLSIKGERPIGESQYLRVVVNLDCWPA